MLIILQSDQCSASYNIQVFLFSISALTTLSANQRPALNNQRAGCRAGVTPLWWPHLAAPKRARLRCHMCTLLAPIGDRADWVAQWGWAQVKGNKSASQVKVLISGYPLIILHSSSFSLCISRDSLVYFTSLAAGSLRLSVICFVGSRLSTSVAGAGAGEVSPGISVCLRVSQCLRGSVPPISGSPGRRQGISTWTK